MLENFDLPSWLCNDNTHRNKTNVINNYIALYLLNENVETHCRIVFAEHAEARFQTKNKDAKLQGKRRCTFIRRNIS